MCASSALLPSAVNTASSIHHLVLANHLVLALTSAALVKFVVLAAMYQLQCCEGMTMIFIMVLSSA